MSVHRPDIAPSSLRRSWGLMLTHRGRVEDCFDFCLQSRKLSFSCLFTVNFFFFFGSCALISVCSSP